MPSEQHDLDRLIADHLAGDESASHQLAALVERDPTARAQVALHLTIDRSLTQLGADVIDINQVMHALPQARGSTMPTRVLRQLATRERRQRRQQRQRLLIPLAVAALLLLSVLALFMRPGAPAAVTPTPGVIATVTPAEGLPRAILRSSPHAQWPHRRAPVDADGRVTTRNIDLRAGFAELEMPSGATLVLQGPTLLELTGNNSVRLTLGRLAGYVPQRAKGFTLQAEGVRVVDLGTAFGLAQDVGGIADLHVFSGEIEASAHIDGVDTVRRLHANQAVRVDVRGGSWAMVPCDPSRFIHGLRPQGFSLDFADLVAGGDGFGTAAADGIDPSNGELYSGPSLGFIEDWKPFFHPVSDIGPVDGVFIPDGRLGPTVVDSANHQFQFPETSGKAYDIIRRGGTYDTPQNGGRPQQPGIPPVIGGINYRAPGRNALGMHANVGLSVDLQHIAYAHPGLRVERFTTMLANVGRKLDQGRADFWVLLDGKLVGHYPEMTPDSTPLALDIAIDGQRYLTLVSTDGGNGSTLDWVTLGDPRIHLREIR
ncbi:MAG: NPCBM/NEW2 domain-containing protein [Planctomycetes bacterium]|nr:NPCBM/NEW2 domain-containing protein [Planctomycetota bacterium]